MRATIKKGEVVLDIEFDYQPWEPSTNHYPGCGESAQITAVIFRGTDITDVIWEFGDMEEIECLVLEEIK